MPREQVARLPIHRYPGTIHLVASDHDLQQAMRAIRRDRIVGLDTETKPAFRKGESHLPCLVQIAAAHAVYLFQLQQTDCSGPLTALLQDPTLIKAGIGLAHDFVSLKNVFPFEPQGIVDLSLEAQRQGIELSGVRNLAGQFLGFRVTKGVATSNWARPHLTQKQITYAATDAWVCRELFFRFRQLGFIDRKGRPLPLRTPVKNKTTPPKHHNNTERT